MDDKRNIVHDSDAEHIFGLLIRAYRHKVIRFVSLFIRDASECEELVSDVFLALWTNRSKLSKIDNPDSYIFVITKNKTFDYLRKSRLKPVKIEDYAIDLFHNTKSTPESIYIDREMTQKLNEAIDSLPPRTKLAFLLVRENKMKYRDAAVVLGVSVKTIEKQVASAVSKLKEILEK